MNTKIKCLHYPKQSPSKPLSQFLEGHRGVTVMSCTISRPADCSGTADLSRSPVVTPIVHRGHLSYPTPHREIAA